MITIKHTNIPDIRAIIAKKEICVIKNNTNFLQVLLVYSNVLCNMQSFCTLVILIFKVGQFHMGTLTIAHWAYLIVTVLLFAMIIRKKEIIVVSIAGIFIVAFLVTKDIARSVQVICRAVISGFTELLPIFIGISLILAMTNALKQSGALGILSGFNESKVLGPKRSYMLIGSVMLLLSLLIWPSPAVALIAALVIPLSSKTGLSMVMIASTINIFGHGIALSGDFFIQGVPAVVAEGAGMNGGDLFSYLVPLWAIMSVVTIVVGVILSGRDSKVNLKINNKVIKNNTTSGAKETIKISRKMAITILSVTVGAFILDFIAMMIWNISGDDATFLVAGTALIVTCIISFMTYKKNKAEEKAMKYVIDGFTFAMKIFAPALMIIAFFSLGNAGMSEYILGEGAPGFIGDFVNLIVDNVNTPDFILAPLQAVIGIMYSIDGSGFAGLTVIGEITQGYGVSVEKTKLLMSLGQIIIIWVGGGTLIPWSVVPVASAFNISPRQLVKTNLIPVACGLAATVLAASVWLLFI